MKILEIIQPKIKDIDVRSSFKNYEKTADSEIGLYSIGKSDPNDPHLYTKTAKNLRGYRNDPFWFYVQNYCLKYQNSNPYFPRIYSYKKFYDNSGNAIPRIKMEKLNTFDKLSNDESIRIMDLMLQKIFNEEFLNEEKSDGNLTNIDDAASLIEVSIKYQGNEKYIIDEKFKEFAHLMRECLSEMKKVFAIAAYDIHSGNILYRLTPHGPQMVVNDPFVG